MVGWRSRRAGGIAAMVAVGMLAGCSARERAQPPAASPDQVAPARPGPPAPPPEAAPRPAPSWKRVAQPPQGNAKLITNFDGPLEVPTGQSILLRLSAPAERVAIADPEVAEVVLINPLEVLINGKGKKGVVSTSNIYTGDRSQQDILQEAKTSIIIWDKNGHSDVRTLYINKSRTEQIALEVTVADLNRGAIEATGFDFLLFQGEILASGTQSKLFNFNQFNPALNNNAPLPPLTANINVANDRLSYLLWSLNDDFVAFIELLQRESLAKILARPIILARSGEQAHFRVGGEVPVVYATNNVATVNFKEFGVIVNVTPLLSDDGQIDLTISTEVSQPTDNFRAVTLGGFSIPAFISRKAETRVKLGEGETLMIGGLYREDETEIEDKTPYLGDLPYLGVLFRKTRFERTRNELLIVVRPRVARRPEDVTPASLPTDRPPLSRSEVRTKLESNEVTRPRLGPRDPATESWPAAEDLRPGR